ncbi:MAG: hypothetical protein ACYC0V_04875 [Armatimonadota bacterium]
MNQLKKITKVKWSAILIFVIIIITLVYLFVPYPWANDDIRYAAFNDMMRQLVSKKGNKISVFFLTLGGMRKKEDPSYSLLSRFKGRNPKVLPESKMKIMGFWGKESEIVIYINDITWVFPNKVLVTYGYYSNRFAVYQQTVSMKYINRKWIVKDIISRDAIKYNF